MVKSSIEYDSDNEREYRDEWIDKYYDFTEDPTENNNEVSDLDVDYLNYFLEDELPSFKYDHYGEPPTFEIHNIDRPSPKEVISKVHDLYMEMIKICTEAAEIYSSPHLIDENGEETPDNILQPTPKQFEAAKDFWKLALRLREEFNKTYTTINGDIYGYYAEIERLRSTLKREINK